MHISKLTLGTAQLGLNYGINNKKGKPSFDESLEILDYAYKNGINSFDTAQSYGNSEKIIGEWIKTSKPQNIFITTKISLSGKNNLDRDSSEKYIYKSIYKSLVNLNLNRIDNLLLHNYEDISIHGANLYEELNRAKNDGLINKIGVSVYNPNEMEHVIELGFDSIQIPTNLFDHRFINSQLLAKASKKGILIFCRSVFLQGIFFMNKKNIPNGLKQAGSYLEKLNTISNKHNISIQEMALKFLSNIKEFNSIILGIENVKQLEKNLEIWKSDKTINSNIILNNFKIIPTKILDPREWEM